MSTDLITGYIPAVGYCVVGDVTTVSYRGSIERPSLYTVVDVTPIL
jgi:hypothetical protein